VEHEEVVVLEDQAMVRREDQAEEVVVLVV